MDSEFRAAPIAANPGSTAMAAPTPNAICNVVVGPTVHLGATKTNEQLMEDEFLVLVEDVMEGEDEVRYADDVAAPTTAA